MQMLTMALMQANFIKSDSAMSITFLCGQKAAGKTYYLNLLGSLYNKEIHSLDNVISTISDISVHSGFKGTIRELYIKLGEEEFRHREKKALENILKSCSNDCFIELGGGALDLVEECGKYGRTVYLFQEKNVLFKRMESLALPPFIKDYEDFLKIFEKRDCFYRKHCSTILDIREMSADDVCKKLIEIGFHSSN